MKNTSKPIAVTLCGIVAVAGAARTLQNARTQKQLSALLQPALQQDEVYDPAKQPARKKRGWQLYNLWSKCSQRDKRSLASQIMPFLQDEHGKLRESAARMLGRLEDPIATAPLQKRLQQVQKGSAHATYVRPEVLQLALGRIEARSLRGQAKVEAVAKRAGLSWSEVKQLSQKVVQSRSLANDTAGQRIVKEVVDVLYQMGGRGEKIQLLAQNLSLYPAQKVLLQSAELPPAKQAVVFVDYLAKLDAVTSYDGDLAEFYLMNLQPHAIQATLQKLNAMRQGTAKHGKRGYLELFRVSALVGDGRAIPLLQHFAKTSSQPMSGYARQALDGFDILKNPQKWISPRSPWAPSLERSNFEFHRTANT